MVAAIGVLWHRHRSLTIVWDIGIFLCSLLSLCFTGVLASLYMAFFQSLILDFRFPFFLHGKFAGFGRRVGDVFFCSASFTDLILQLTGRWFDFVSFGPGVSKFPVFWFGICTELGMHQSCCLSLSPRNCTKIADFRTIISQGYPGEPCFCVESMKMGRFFFLDLVQIEEAQAILSINHSLRLTSLDRSTLFWDTFFFFSSLST